MLTALSLLICPWVNGQQDKTMKDFKVMLPEKQLPLPTPLESGKNSGYKMGVLNNI